jgi:4-hydroxy-2-oxoheptanedioate aldolase
MEMPVNAFKRSIRDGQPQIGLWCSSCSNITAEVIAGAGFDWILIDTEHAPNELPMVLSQLQAMVDGTAAPVVRPAWNDLVLIKRLLDAGAQNLLVPYVQTVEEARGAVAAVRYPPQGGGGGGSAPRESFRPVRITSLAPTKRSACSADRNQDRPEESR